MAYKITKSDGSLLTNVQDYTTDTSTTSISILGRGAVNYGQALAENSIHMLENFASPTPPENPIVGQFWFHTLDNSDGSNTKSLMIAKVYVGGDEGEPKGWKQIGGTNASSEPPKNPYTGEMWFNGDSGTLYSWNGSEWYPMSATPSQDAPKDANGNLPVDGTTWLMLPEHMFWVYDSSLNSPEPSFTRIGGKNDGKKLTGGWRLIGPQYPTGSGTGASYNIFKDANGNSHNVVVNYINGVPLSVDSDSNFTIPSADLPNFTTHNSSPGNIVISAGNNINDAFARLTGDTAKGIYNGTSTNTKHFDDLASSEFLGRGDTFLPTTPAADNITTFGSTSARWSQTFSTEFFAGASTPSSPDISSVNVIGKSYSAQQADHFTKPVNLVVSGDIDGNASFDGSNPNVSLSVALSQGVQGRLGTIEGNISALQSGLVETTATAGNALTQAISDDRYIQLNGGTGDHSVSGSIGSANSQFSAMYAAKFYGEAVSADYSDLAECYAADAVYTPGTVMKIGGNFEITPTTSKADPDVFGIVSTDPAYLMNASKNQAENYHPIALSGRIPVRIVGPIKKGERIIPSNVRGTAQSAGMMADILKLEASEKETILASIIGRALADNDIPSEKIVECYVQTRH